MLKRAREYFCVETTIWVSPKIAKKFFDFVTSRFALLFRSPKKICLFGSSGYFWPEAVVGLPRDEQKCN